ncbi:MAG: MBL fold metallo-hydrolase [Candidatus Omnitrophota bacterium]|nr:MBL fold metallo-hydrolase [Candidatus Omnitrophota bacterium]
MVLRVIVLLFSLSFAFASPARAELAVRFFDVGFGDAILIVFPNGHTMFIDAGNPTYGPKLRDYLFKHNLRMIDTAIITHPHANHFGGFIELAMVFPIHRLYVNGDESPEEPYADFQFILNARNIEVTVLKHGDVIEGLSKEVTMKVLSPAQLSGNPNDDALVLKLDYNDVSFLFTSDISPTMQRNLISNYGDDLKADLVQIPHHGGPIDPVFAGFFPDSMFVISTGTNGYDLPRADELEWLPGRVMRTDQGGSLTFSSDGQSISVIQEP